MKKYVVGFMFSPMLQMVALIRKQKPEWQAGKLNGVGGKVEDGETSIAAMVREFQEETGTVTGEFHWKHFCSMTGSENDSKGGAFSIDFFATTGDVCNLQSPEVEKIEVVECSSIKPHRTDVIENIPWLVALAIDFMRDGRPQFALVSYP